MKCKHKDTTGVMKINKYEYGLCTECRHLINLNLMMKVASSAEDFLLWVSTHSVELRKYKMWEVYDIFPKLKGYDLVKKEG